MTESNGKPARATKRPSLRELIQQGRAAAGHNALDMISEHALELFEPGEVIPGTDYRILRFLGEGDSGVLYEVENLQIKRRAAVKILRSALTGQRDELLRFRNAARTVNQIGSENIVQIFDFAKLPDGRVLIAMEMLDGNTLAKALQLGPMSPSRAIGILRQVCKALAAAHSTGVVHGNIEPSNIMLVTTGSRPDAVKLLSFSFAAPTTDRDETQPTSRYASPEARLGNDPDGRADVYALGCTAYEMLSGRPPPTTDAEAETEASTRLLDVPEAIVAVLERCLAEDPVDRYADMADLEAALCEAQIEAGLTTPWDDLPLPEVEGERRDKILAAFGGPATSPTSSRWRWVGAFAVAAVLGTGGIVIASAGSDTPAATTAGTVDRLVGESRAAAAKAFYVYPSPDEPDHFTAYSKIRELERSGAEGATAAAADLRAEFAQTLFRLGDRYWNQEGGRRFAMAYYAQGLVFEPSNTQALERSDMSSGDLRRLQEKAAEARFDEDGLLEAEPLLVLAVEDEVERERKMDELRERRLARAAEEDAQLEALVSGEDVVSEPTLDGGQDAPAPTKAHKSSPGKSSEDLDRERVLELLEAYLARAELDDDDAKVIRTLIVVLEDENAVPPEAALVPEPEPEPEPAAEEPEPPAPSAKKKPGPTNRDPKLAEALAKKGDTLSSRGRYSEAETLYHQALAADNHNARALGGLATVHFERGNYQKAVTYGKRAVAASPGRGSYRMRLGDALFKVSRYKDAETQYAKAVKLGYPQAQAALDKVRRRTGG